MEKTYKSMKVNKLLLSLVVLGFVLLFSVSPMISAIAFSSSNITVYNPLAGGTVSGTSSKISVSLEAGFETENWTAVRIFAVSSGATANTTVVKLIQSLANDTATTFNGTINTTGLEDGNDYTITVHMRNGSNIVNKTVAVTINNTVPTTPTALFPSANSKQTNKSITFSATVSGSKTTACTLTFSGTHPGSTSYSMTHSGNNCTKSLLVPDQTYAYTITATDGTDSRTTSTTYFSNDQVSGSVRGGVEVDKARNSLTQKINGNGLMWILVIAGLSVGLYFIFRKK